MTSSTRSRLAAALALAVPGATLAVAQDSDAQRGVNLAPLFVDGERDTYQLTIDADMSISLMGSAQTTGSYMEASFVVELSDVTDQGATATVTFERIRVQFDGRPPLDGDYDTASKIQPDPDAVLPKIIRPVIGKPVTVQLDAWGQIRSIKGLEALAPDGIHGGLFLELFDDDAMYSMLSPVFLVRPQGDDAPASPARGIQAVGSTWEVRKPSVPSLGIRSQDLDLTLEAVRGRDARIEIEGEPDDRPPREARSIPGVQATSSSVTGNATWDLTEGELKDLSTKSVLEFGSDSGGFVIDVDVTSTTTLKRVSSGTVKRAE